MKTAWSARSRARGANGVTLEASTRRYKLEWNATKSSKCERSRDRAALNSVITKPGTSHYGSSPGCTHRGLRLPHDGHQPQPTTSTPTEIMLVASTTSWTLGSPSGAHQLEMLGILELATRTSSQLAARVFGP